MKRIFLYASLLLCLPSLAHSWALVLFHHSNDNSVIAAKAYCTMCGLNNNAPVPNVSGAYCTCHGRSVVLSRVTLGTSTPCDPSDLGSDVIALSDRLGDYYGSLPSGSLPAIDYDTMGSNFDPNNPMIVYFPNGRVLSGSDGLRYVVTDSPDGENRYGTVFVNGVAQGYQNGKSGSYAIATIGEGQYTSNFTADWTGGVSESGSTSSFSGSSSSSSVVPYSGSDSTSAFFDTPSTTTATDSNGETYQVISAPSQSVTLDNGSSITLYDYSSLLNAIGANVSSGFNKLHDDLDLINENQRKQLETDEAVSVAENTDPSFDTSAAESEAQEQLDIINQEGSGWGFDFGLGSNPVGDLITSFFGNPPTHFGSQNQVCQVSFDLPLVGTLQYTFNLSDWFPGAFRSCILMILTFFFAIASAKAVSGAFQ